MSKSEPSSAIGADSVPHALLLIGGEWVDSTERGAVYDKFDGSLVATTAEASREQVAEAVAKADAAFRRGAPPPPERAEMLLRARQLLQKRRDDVIETMIAEAGFTRGEATGEYNRALETLLASAEEARRLVGEVIPMDSARGQQNRLGFTMLSPLGVVCAITPFNSPLNTVLHKVGPTLASGNALILKPASATPLTSALLVEVLLEAGVPPEFVSLIHGPGGRIGQWLCEEQAVKFYAFTGSTEVGKRIHSAAGLRRTQMELGSIAATILNQDADLDTALPKVINAGYRKAGQVCTSIQRLYVHQSIFDEVTERLTTSVRALKAGNPHDEATDIGPLISEADASRVESWVGEAVKAGATLLAGGTRHGSVVEPVLLSDVTADMRVMSEEIFGPVVVLRPFDHLDDAVDEINATPYGLATGIFTRDIEAGLHAAKRLNVGGVHINETSSSRVDVMPYGGCKDSGFGREGPHYAIREMMEEKLVTVTLAGLGGR